MKNSLSFFLKASLLVYVGVLILLTVNVFHLKQTKTKHETTNKIARNESPVCKNVTIKPEANINEILRFGPGENGQAVKIGALNLSIPELVALDKKHRFTTFISDMVGIRRRLPDKRPAACLTKKYPDDLPPVGIVIIFRDELASIVLRTVYSVLQMSPPKLIKEIILVDDGSKDELLRLAVAIHAEALEKVRIVRNEVPKGLMMARQAGVDALTADYFIIMDGHMEVVPGWLEPLIFRLVQEPRALLCSHVGQVDDKDFQFRIGDGDIQVFPFFDPLNLNQMFAPYRKEFLLQRNGSVDPLPAGTVQGMMIVMKTDFFLALGGFDPGMQVWGSEQIELSVKVWMCGGRVEMIPCSMVGHMYRITPWGGYDPGNDFHSSNKARMIHVWVDPPYSDFINNQLSDKNFTEGDISSRKAIRERNHCKPYQHFVDTVKTFSDIYFPTKALRRGFIRNKSNRKCLDIATEQPERKKKIIIYDCHKKVSANQYFIYTESKQIRSEGSVVLQAVLEEGKEPTAGIKIQPEDLPTPLSMWTYSKDRMIRNMKAELCLAVNGLDSLVLKNCTGQKDQLWDWKF